MSARAALMIIIKMRDSILFLLVILSEFMVSKLYSKSIHIEEECAFINKFQIFI